MMHCLPEEAVIVIMNYGTTGHLSDWAELHISNGKIDVERLVSYLPQIVEGEDLDDLPFPNYTDMHSMN